MHLTLSMKSKTHEGERKQSHIAKEQVSLAITIMFNVHHFTTFSLFVVVVSLRALFWVSAALVGRATYALAEVN